MSHPLRIKVCGLARTQDISQAISLGADYCGVIVFEKSPRAVSAERACCLSAEIPDGKRVLVDVSPSAERLAAHQRLGFNFYQIHFDPDRVPPALVKDWSRIVGRSALWLSPHVSNSALFPEYLFELADTFVVDTYRPGIYGGTGQTGNWRYFGRMKEAFPKTNWILAGGLTSENVAIALAQSKADIVDVNSGVESSPGCKDPAKLAAFFAEARSPADPS